MDPVTTAIIAAVLVDGDNEKLLMSESQEKIVSAYDELKALLAETFSANSKLIEAVYRLENVDTPAHRQMLHQEVKIVQADQNPTIVQAADQLLNTINDQPSGDRFVLAARTWQEL